MAELAERELELGQSIQKRLSELEEIYRTVEKTADLIDKAKVQYVKRQIKARNKKQVEEQEEYFADVKDYTSIEQIRDDYGWELISEDEMYRLMDKWEAYRTAKQNNNRYRDAVTDMLDLAISQIRQKYREQTDEYLALKEQIESERREYRWTHRED